MKTSYGFDSISFPDQTRSDRPHTRSIRWIHRPFYHISLVCWFDWKSWWSSFRDQRVTQLFHSLFFVSLQVRSMQRIRWNLFLDTTYTRMFSLIWWGPLIPRQNKFCLIHVLILQYWRYRCSQNSAVQVCEPSLTLPLTMGLYAKWGSGKSLLLSKLRVSLINLSYTLEIP